MLIQSTPALHPSRRFSRIFKSSSHCPVGPAASGDGGSRETYRSVSLSPLLAGEGAAGRGALSGELIAIGIMSAGRREVDDQGGSGEA